MKKIISLFILAASASPSLLFAENKNRLEATNRVIGCRLEDRLEAIGYRLEEEKKQGTDNRKAELTLENQIGQRIEPTTNCNNQSDNFDCYLMMDPKAVEEGIEDLKGVFGSSGKTASPSKTAVTTTTATGSPIGNSASSAGLLEKGGAEIMAALTTEESAEGTDVSRFLEDEICNNIYQSCLAKVAQMSLDERKTAEGIAQEKEEWEAAKDMASEDKEDCERALVKAQKAAAEAQKQFDSANAIVHGKAYADKAYYKWQVADLAEKLAEARVETARATLNAIKFRNTAQRAKAEAKLAEAIEMECNASKALDGATANSSLTTSENLSSKSTAAANGFVAPVLEASSSSCTLNFCAPSTPCPSSASAILKIGSEKDNNSTSFTPPKPPTLGSKIVETEQIFSIPSMPIATEVAVSAANNFTIGEPFNQLKISDDGDVKEKAEALTQKEKAVATFEAEFSAMIENARIQAEEVAVAATVAREKAEKIGISEKAWNEALGEAEIAENAYAHLAGLYKMYQEQVTDHYEGGMLNAKRSKYNIDLQRAEKKKGNWTTEIKECRQKKEDLKKGVIGKTILDVQTDAVLNKEHVIVPAQIAEKEKSLKVQENVLPQEKEVLKQQEIKLLGGDVTKIELEKKKVAEPVQVVIPPVIITAGEVTIQSDLDKALQALQSMPLEITKATAVAQATKANEFIKEAQKKILVAQSDELVVWKNAVVAAQKASEYWVKVAKVDFATHQREGHCLAEVAQKYQIIADYRTQEAQARAVGNSKDASRWDSAASDMNVAVNFLVKRDEYSQKAEKARSEGHLEEATRCDELTQKYQVIADYRTQEAQARAVGKSEEASRWYNIANTMDAVINSLIKKDEYLKKAEQAKAQGRLEEASRWDELTQKCQMLADYRTQENNAYIILNKEDSNRYYSSANAMDAAIHSLVKRGEYLQKAEKARSEEHSEEASCWDEFAQKYQIMAEYRTQRAQASAAGKKEDGILWDNAITPMQQAIDYLMKRDECLQKAERTRAKGNSEETGHWDEVAQKYQIMAEYRTESAQAHAVGKKEEGSRWYDAASAMEVAANLLMRRDEYLENAKKARDKNHTEEASRWDEIARKLCIVVKYRTQTAQAYAAKNENEHKRWFNASNLGQGVIKDLTTCINRLQKLEKARSQGNQQLVDRWAIVIKVTEELAEYENQAAQVYAEGNVIEGKRLEDVINVLRDNKLNMFERAAQCFEKSVPFLEKAEKSREEGQSAAANYWTEVAQEYKKASEEFTTAAQACTAGNESESKVWIDLAKSSMAKAGDLAVKVWKENDKKEAEVVLVGDHKVIGSKNTVESTCSKEDGLAQDQSLLRIEDDRKQVETCRAMGTKMYVNSVRADAEGKKDEGKSWNNAGMSLKFAAEKLEKAIAVESTGKLGEAQQWREIAEQYKCSVEPYTQAAKAHKEGKTEEGKNWDSAGEIFKKIVEKLEKVIVAENAGKPEEAQKWREVGEQYKCSVEPYLQAAIAYKESKTEEGKSWNAIASNFGFIASNLEKAIKAESSVKPEVALKLGEASEQYNRSIELQHQAVKAFKEEKNTEGDSWNRAAYGLSGAAIKLGYAIEAEDTNKPEVAKTYREAAEQDKCAADLYTQAAKAYASGREDEGKRLYDEGKIMKDVADAMARRG